MISLPNDQRTMCEFLLIYNQAQTISLYTDILFNVVHRTTRFALKQLLVVPFY